MGTSARLCGRFRAAPGRFRRGYAGIRAAMLAIAAATLEVTAGTVEITLGFAGDSGAALSGMRRGSLRNSGAATAGSRRRLLWKLRRVHAEITARYAGVTGGYSGDSAGTEEVRLQLVKSAALRRNGVKLRRHSAILVFVRKTK
jgi:hypothetical protein